MLGLPGGLTAGPKVTAIAIQVPSGTDLRLGMTGVASGAGSEPPGLAPAGPLRFDVRQSISQAAIRRRSIM